jgi:hypothetical protein
VLRSQQALWAVRAGSVDLGTDTSSALAALDVDQAKLVPAGDSVLRGPFRYDANTEEQRYARVRQVIERVQPGPFEDVNFFLMLARKAASVEMVMSGQITGKGLGQDVFDHIVIGSTGEPRSEAYSALAKGAVAIAVSAGMMDFLYQSAKSVVRCWRLKQNDGGYGFLTGESDVEAVLDEDPYPVNCFCDTPYSWLVAGVPRPAYSSLPEEKLYQTPLEMLIVGSETFVIGHEYGHALMHHLKVLGELPAEPTSWDREFQADTIACRAVVDCGRLLDRLPTELALQGGFFSMKVHSIFEEVMAAIRHSGIGDSKTHPPFDQRQAVIEHLYRTNYSNGDADGAIDGMVGAARTLGQVWLRAKPLLYDRLEGQALHPIWHEHKEGQA